jgi:hypothetical protein
VSWTDAPDYLQWAAGIVPAIGALIYAARAARRKNRQKALADERELQAAQNAAAAQRAQEERLRAISEHYSDIDRRKPR